MTIRINLDKRIGNVLFVVEGAKTEFSILKRVFCSILDYSFVESRRGSLPRFLNRNDRNSCVAVVNTINSHIASITREEEYLDSVYSQLITEFNYPIDKAAVFFLFDRDPKSNTDLDIIQDYIKTFQNPYDNPGDIRAGQLLLSYPSVEAFTVSNFVRDSYNLKFGLGSELKAFVSTHSEIQLNKISEDSLKTATEAFYKFVNDYEKSIDIDDFSKTSMEIFLDEEELFKNESRYRIFSMLVLALLQLGIIEVGN